MKKIILIIMATTLLGACSMTPTESEFADLYTGHDESGSWYHFSHSCSAQLCPPN